jgi:hypothetical protein
VDLIARAQTKGLCTCEFSDPGDGQLSAFHA